MIVYGKNVFSIIEEEPQTIEKIYIQKGIRDQKLVKRVQNLNKDIQFVPRPKLDQLAQDSHHNGICIQVQDIPTYDLDTLLNQAKNPGLLVALDGIQDPHNLGAILRTCDCVGVDGVILCKHNSVGLTPTAIKASTGAAYTIPVSTVTNLKNALVTCKEKGYWIVGSDMEQARDYRQGIYDVPVVLVIGSEGKGISSLVKKQCDYMVKLPMEGKISSLNASVACAVLLYQIHQNRHPL